MTSPLPSRLCGPTCSPRRRRPRLPAHTAGLAARAAPRLPRFVLPRWPRPVRAAAPPAPPGLADPAGLTPRELEIARLAASGLSSRAIAAQLVVAVRTVD